MQDQEQASIQQTHACSDSRIEITNQAHSTHFSMSRKPENSDWLQKFRIQRIIETSG